MEIDPNSIVMERSGSALYFVGNKNIDPAHLRNLPIREVYADCL